MKKLIFILFIILLSIPMITLAGDPPPIGGDPTGDPGAISIGGSAPIGSGIIYLVGLSVIYGLYLLKKFNINLKSIK